MSGQHTYAREGTYTVHVTRVGHAVEQHRVLHRDRGGVARSQPSIALSASGTVTTGDTITVDGSGFAAGEQVTVSVGTDPARSHEGRGVRGGNGTSLGRRRPVTRSPAGTPSPRRGRPRARRRRPPSR